MVVLGTETAISPTVEESGVSSRSTVKPGTLFDEPVSVGLATGAGLGVGSGGVETVSVTGSGEGSGAVGVGEDVGVGVGVDSTTVGSAVGVEVTGKGEFINGGTSGTISSGVKGVELTLVVKEGSTETTLF